MTTQNTNIKAFAKLGEFLTEYCKAIANDTFTALADQNWFEKLNQTVETAFHHNGWFTKENLVFALAEWSNALSEENLTSWLDPYDIAKNKTKKKVALILAGNIPMVGFHDLLSVLITGNNAIVKLSSNDKLLLPLLVDYLIDVNPEFTGRVLFTEERLSNFDAVIATGSNNTARYFEYYFGKKPNIIRKNRNSIAILTGKETKTQLEALGEDIFRYYGLGCRSVSKLFVPKGYNFDGFYKAMYPYNEIINQHKYANNYDYNKAVYLMSEFDILDNGFLMLKKDSSYASPIATLFYEEYESEEDIKLKIANDLDAIQCIVSDGLFDNEIAFGRTQTPNLWDYADGVDTVEFLLKTTKK